MLWGVEELLERLFDPQTDGTESFRQVGLNIFPGTEGNHGPRETEVTLNEKPGILK